jgi:hypothetical protein
VSIGGGFAMLEVDYQELQQLVLETVENCGAGGGEYTLSCTKNAGCGKNGPAAGGFTHGFGSIQGYDVEIPTFHIRKDVPGRIFHQGGHCVASLHEYFQTIFPF